MRNTIEQIFADGEMFFYEYARSCLPEPPDNKIAENREATRKYVDQASAAVAVYTQKLQAGVNNCDRIASKLRKVCSPGRERSVRPSRVGIRDRQGQEAL